MLSLHPCAAFATICLTWLNLGDFYAVATKNPKILCIPLDRDGDLPLLMRRVSCGYRASTEFSGKRIPVMCAHPLQPSSVDLPITTSERMCKMSVLECSQCGAIVQGDFTQMEIFDRYTDAALQTNTYCSAACEVAD